MPALTAGGLAGTVFAPLTAVLAEHPSRHAAHAVLADRGHR
ncbi:hypothetical protein ACH4MA_24835 [Streptomyces roseolus]